MFFSCFSFHQFIFISIKCQNPYFSLKETLLNFKSFGQDKTNKKKKRSKNKKVFLRRMKDWGLSCAPSCILFWTCTDGQRMTRLLGKERVQFNGTAMGLLNMRCRPPLHQSNLTFPIQTLRLRTFFIMILNSFVFFC